jgi:hypothetical protein
VEFIVPHAHTITTNAALRIEKGTSVPSFTVNFDLFEERYAGSFWHLGESLAYRQ